MPGRQPPSLSSIAILLALPLLAQDDVWFVEVTAPQPYVLSGRTLQLEARATSVAGAPSDAGLQWRSSNPTIADVDESGRVRGLLPGEAVIEAAHGDVRGRLILQVQPARIRLDPADLDLETGQQTGLTAVALDADGAAIPGVRFVWTSGVPAVASVDGAGGVTGLSEGAVTVTALLDIPDLGFGFSAQARVRVRARAPFRSTRVVASDSQTRPVTLRHIDNQSTAGDRSAFTAVLSNGSYALMVADNTGLRPLALTGDYFEPTGQVITGFSGVTMNASGEVMAALNLAPWPNRRLVRFPATGPPEPLDFSNDYRDLNTHSLGPNGELLFFGWNERGQNILYRRPDGRIDRVTAQSDPVPGFGTVNWFGELTAPVNGKAIFLAQGSNRNALVEWDGGAVRKLLASGDPILGRTVQYLDSPILTSSGDVYLRIGGDNFSQIVRLSGGQWSNVVQSGQLLTGGTTVQWIDSLRDGRGSTVVFSGGSDRGGGLFRYDGTTFELLARYGTAADEWRWIEYAALDSRGGVFARGTSGNIASRLVRVGSGGSPVPLAETGRSLEVGAGAGVGWLELLGGSNASVPVFLSSAHGLVRAEAGRADAVLVHGDSLPEGETLFWTAAVASSRDGGFAFRAGSPRGEAIYLWRNGRVTRLIQNWDGARVPGGTIRWFGGTMAANTRGQVVVDTSYDGGFGLFLFTEGAAPQTIAINGGPAPGGGVFQGIGPVALDERGRVAFFADTGSGSVLFYWDNGQLRRLRQVGDNGITAFDNWRFQAAGDRIYVFTRFGNAQEISSYDGASWRPALTDSPYRICSSWFSAASNGDILYSACLPDGVNGLVVRKPDGRDIPVAATSQRSADGDWFVQILTWVLSEQGDVFFTALTPAGPKDRITLFRATPQ